MSVFVTVENGCFVVDNGWNSDPHVFEPNQVGLRGMADFFKKAAVEGAVMCSSSVDNAHEYGLPEDFDAGNFVGLALGLAEGLEGAKLAALSYDHGLKSVVWN